MIFKSETISLIEDDHRQIRKHLGVLLNEKLSIAEKRAAFSLLAPIIDSHAQREELAVYEYMIDVCDDLETLALEGEVEHSLIDELLGKLKLKEKDISNREWIASAQVFAELVQHHLTEEEERMFPELKKCLDAKTDKEVANNYRNTKILSAPFRKIGVRDALPLLVTLLLTIGSGAHAETTAVEHAENTANTASDTVKETVRTAEDKTCEMVNGKMQCVAKKVKNKAKTVKDKAGTEIKKLENEAD